MTTIEVDGTRVEYRQLGAGRDLVLLHSLLTDLTVFDDLAPVLGRTRRVTLLNLPGYGASAPIAPGIERCADHVAAAMRALALPRQTDVFGNGFGGFTALALAIRHGARFDRLLIADALAAFPAEGKTPLQAMAARVEAEGMNAVLDTAIKRMFPDAFVAAHPDVIAARKAALAKADASAFAGACRALAALDIVPLLGTIRNPTLVMVGALDATTAPQPARRLADGIAGCRFELIEECGHCPMLEKPRELLALMNGFLG